ncbi:S-layer homology domain-containing protein [Paenibacillus sp. YYML68]|uniref:S-layer homology domain-containing protein n=1 Tax=Paenibacillus sp. YYML68 TaxID=2909250 RepID=UPI002490B82C|nr:S-layer homology domain-containing protein [Paenibacillus sp. YYML68]
MKQCKWTKLAVVTSLIMSIAAAPAAAFEDLEAGQRESVLSLKERGIVNGVDSKHFAPRSKTSYAEAVHLLVKAFDLNIDHMKFIKKPEASDYFTQVPNDAWYSESFVIAHLNGIPLPKDISPDGIVTRERFADMIIHAIDTKGTFPVIKMLIIFEDEADIDPALSYSVQRLVLHGIVKQQEDRRFNPKSELTRGEAAVWVYQAVQFVNSHTKPQQQEKVTVKVEKVNADVNKVILSRGEKPTAGYAIRITGILFEEDGRAIITYKVTDPAPDSMNAMVITEPTAETYVASGYEITAQLDRE